LTTKNRRSARTLALQALYELDCTNHPLEAVMLERLEEVQLDDEQRGYAYAIINGVRDHRTEIDMIIQRFAPEWPLDQVAIIDRSLLRMAIFEFAFAKDTPAAVAINEAVDLAKLFGSESAPRFVNGVLGSVVARESDWWLEGKTA